MCILNTSLSLSSWDLLENVGFTWRWSPLIFGDRQSLPRKNPRGWPKEKECPSWGSLISFPYFFGMNWFLIQFKHPKVGKVQPTWEAPERPQSKPTKPTKPTKLWWSKGDLRSFKSMVCNANISGGEVGPDFHQGEGGGIPPATKEGDDWPPMLYRLNTYHISQTSYIIIHYTANIIYINPFTVGKSSIYFERY